MIETVKKHKGKIVSGSGIAAILGAFTVSGLQYHENVALVDSNKATYHALEVMGDRYESLVNQCMERIDREAER